MKSDNKPALRSIVDDVGRLKVADGTKRYVVEHSFVELSERARSNRMIERSNSIRVWTRAGVPQCHGGKMGSRGSTSSSHGMLHRRVRGHSVQSVRG